MVLGWRADKAAKKELAEADRLWNAGQRADAATKYKAVLDRGLRGIPSDADKPSVYQRVIDAELEQGNADAARARVEEALDKKVEVAAGTPAAAQLVAQVRADRERRAAEEQARREAEAKRKQDEREEAAKKREEERVAAAKRREEELENRPRISALLLEVREGPFRTAAGHDTTMVYADWKNTGNRPIRAVYATIKVLDSQGRELYAPSDYAVYAVASDKPGIAPGETYVEPKGEGHVLPP